MSDEVKTGQVREAEQAPSMKGKVAPDRITVGEPASGDAFMCKRAGGRPVRMKTDSIAKRFPIVVQGASAPAAETMPTQPAPLARVREALEYMDATGTYAVSKPLARAALAALAPLEDVFPDAMQALHYARHTTGDADPAWGVAWRDCARCAALLEGKS